VLSKLNNSIELARQIRIVSVTNSHRASVAHLGSALSSSDILAVVHSNFLSFDEKGVESGNNVFVLSKGHAAIALYAALHSLGIITDYDLSSFATHGSVFEEHPNHKIPTVPFPTGSLGHGLSLSAGMALGKKLSRQSGRVFVLLSDGECNEGTVWESVQFILSKGIKNITLFVDHNKLQATGSTQETLGSISLSSTFKAFGWDAFDIDGHSHQELMDSIRRSQLSDSPTALICHTIKGKGISFMENDNNWHYKSPNDSEYSIAMRELQA
jgi:transketolase